MRKPKKPIKRKLPKKPKIGASLEKWKEYENNVINTRKYNKERMALYLKQLKEYKKYLGGSSSAALVTLPPKNTPPTLSNAKKLN